MNKKTSQFQECIKEHVHMTLLRGPMGLVEDISSDPQPLVLSPDVDKTDLGLPPSGTLGIVAMLKNPFARPKTFDVDLKVIKENGEITKYIVLKVHGECP